MTHSQCMYIRHAIITIKICLQTFISNNYVKALCFSNNCTVLLDFFQMPRPVSNVNNIKTVQAYGSQMFLFYLNPGLLEIYNDNRL